MPRLSRVHEDAYHMVHPSWKDLGRVLRHGEGGDRMNNELDFDLIDAYFTHLIEKEAIE